MSVIREVADECYVKKKDRARHFILFGSLCIVLMGSMFGAGWYFRGQQIDTPEVSDRVDISVSIGDISISFYDGSDAFVYNDDENFSVMGIQIHGFAYDNAFLSELELQGFSNETDMVDYFNITKSDIIFNFEVVSWEIGSWVSHFGSASGLNMSDGEILNGKSYSFMVENKSIVITNVSVYIMNSSSGEIFDVTSIEIHNSPTVVNLSQNNATGLWRDGLHTISFDRFTYYESDGEISSARMTIDGEILQKNCTTLL